MLVMIYARCFDGVPLSGFGSMMRFFSVLCVSALICLPLGARAAHQHAYVEVDHDTYPVDMMRSYMRVRNWLETAQAEIDKIMYTTHPRVAAWRNAILAVPMGDDRAMLAAINAITNRHVPYIADYGMDHWASPVETLLQGGDCEDIALLKAMALHLKRWDTKGDNSMRLLIGLLDDRGRSMPHAVLEVDARDDAHYVLNNLDDVVRTFDDMNLKMKPLYMVDSTGVIEFVKPRRSLASVAATAGARDGETTPIMWDDR